jgi:hypothetical protein
VRHAGSFPELEDQLCAMTGDGYSGDGSPDRLDALVWAITDLMLDASNRLFSYDLIRSCLDPNLKPLFDEKQTAAIFGAPR